MDSSKGKRTLTLDANVILRYLLRDNEELYSKAEKIFNEALLGKIRLFIPIFVFAEVVYVLQKVYKVNRVTISKVLLELLQLKSVKTEDRDILQKALELYATKNMDFADCLLCTFSLKSEVISFDEDVNRCIKAYKKQK